MTFWNRGLSLVLVAMMFATNLVGQVKTKNGDLYLGPEIKSDRKGTLEDIIGMDGDGYYMVRAEPKKFYLEKYDHKLNQVKSEEIILGKGGDRKYLEFAEQLNDEIYLFTTQYDNIAKHRILFAEKVNRKTLKPDGDPIKLSTYDYRNRSNEGYFDYHVSRDSSKILIYYDTPNQSGNTGEKFGLSVYDHNLNALWSKELELPFRDKLYKVERYKVDNQGNAYLLGMVYRGQVRDKRQGRPNYEYHLLVYNKSDEYTEYLLSLQDKFITDMQFEISRTGDIICAGLYSDFGTSSVKGTFYLLIDGKTNEVKKEYYEQFDPSFLVDFMSEKRAGKGRELTRYNLNQLEIRRDGGVVLVAEQFFVKELHQNFNDPRFRSPYSNPFFYPGYYYYYPMWRFPYRYGYPYMNDERELQYNYNDIIVINIDPNGSIQWAKRIPKRQSSKDDGGRYSSYAMSISKGKMFFVFNDNPKNLDKTSGDQRIHNFTKGKESTVVLVSLDGRGEVEKESLFQVKDTKTITKPLVCEQISTDQMIIYSEKNKKATFARLTFR
jgi:hypothetical protein